MAGYINYDDPYDFGGALQRGLEGGRVRRAKTEAKGYLDQGDYDAAAKTLLPYDPEQAQNYLTYGKRKADQDYSSGVTPYLAKNDFEGAKQYAVSKSRPVDDLMKLETWASSARDQEKKAMADKLDQAASGLYAAAQFAETGDMDGYNGAIEALAGQGFDMKPFQGQPYNPARLNAELVKSQKGLEILTARRAERKLDLDERRVGATELTAQAAMARADNAGGGGGFGKAPPGYRWTPDGGQEVIPGGPAEIKENAANDKRAVQKRKADLTVQGMQATSENLLRAIDEAKTLSKGWLNTGLGAGVTARTPGTDAHNLERVIETIKANLGFDKLAEMRAASPTGGALGSVTERELSFLQNTVASLDQSQSDEQLRKNLDIVAAHIQSSLRRIQDAYDTDGYNEQTESQAAPSAAGGSGQRLTPEQAAALPPGTPFIGMDGKQRVRK